ncbi:MAG: 30S ribosomal protein S11, partial [Chloroflexi bacterium]|nr:30S ribosomal protein S11 [Chloroflexota bacterium]
MGRTQRVKRTTSKKTKRVAAHGHVHIHSSFNNTIVTITDTNGNA